MINTMADTIEAWYRKLKGAITPDVFIESAPEDTTGNYVLLRAEGETDGSNKGYFGKVAIVIVDIVTEFQSMVNTREVDDIDNEITSLVLPSVGTHGLAVSGFQISNLSVENTTYLLEDDGVRKYYRKIIRYNHLINE